MTKQILFELNIPEYITHVQLSQHRRVKYYAKGDKIPVKHDSNIFDKQGRLLGPNGIPVVKNPRVAGTPSWKKINGQEFYKGTGNPIMRSKVIGAMKDFFRPYFDDISPIAADQMPITVELEIHDNPVDEFDIDNLAWVYTKVILDVMTEKKIVPDDNVNFIAKSGGCQFVRTKPGELRQLIVSVSKNEYAENQKVIY
jgi:hypothetical protein